MHRAPQTLTRQSPTGYQRHQIFDAFVVLYEDTGKFALDLEILEDLYLTPISISALGDVLELLPDPL